MVKTKEEKKEPTDNTPDAPIKPTEPTQATKLVDDTNLAAKRLEDATAAAKAERIAAEISYAKMKLGGKAEAGTEAKEETEDEKWAKDAEKRYEGTGMSPVEDKTPTTYK